ncbi:MAG: hypothetical protein FWG75_04720 [Cystobacterineae bacterium]|nr:hypothetical protein [Cystobacterineae bacterium]
MKARKLLVFGILLPINMACNTGGIFIDACRVGDNSCPAAHHCVGFWGNHLGSAGSCQPELPEYRCLADDAECHDTPECHVGDNSCPAGQRCAGLGDNKQDGAPGTCQATPNDTPECHVGDNTCAEGYVCEGAGAAPPGDAGSCEDMAECRVGSTTNTCAEEDSYACIGIDSAEEGAPGTCEDIAECRVGESNCPTGQSCIGILHNGGGAAGVCRDETLGEGCEEDAHCLPGQLCEADAGGTSRCTHGERDENGHVVATLSNFQLRIGGQLIVPFRPHGATQDNPNAGWVGAGEAEMRILARGPGANMGLEVYIPGGQLNPTACRATTICTNHCEWSCTLSAGWAGSGPTTAIQVGMGPITPQLWSYRVSTAPGLHFNVPPTAMLGETLTLCVSATTTQAPVQSLNIWEVELEDSPLPPAPPTRLPLHWRETVISNRQKCWSAHLPLSLGWQGTTRLRVWAEAMDSAGNLSSARYAEPLELIRVSCATTFPGTVSAPLTFINGRLVFAVDTRLHVMDADTCSLVGTLNTGSIRGPMVALGDGRLAVASTGRGGPPGRQTARLLMINTSAQPVFAQNAAEECSVGMAGTDAMALFDKGLSLLSLSPVRYASPANTGSNSVLVAYAPGEEASRCIGTHAMGAPIALALAQADNAEVLVAYGNAQGNTISALRFNAQNAQWESGSWVGNNVSSGNLLGIALSNHGSLWLSSSTTPPFSGLQLWRRWGAVPTNHSSGSYRFFPAAVDSQGRAYVVDYRAVSSGSAYELNLLHADIGGQIDFSTVLPSGMVNDIVGSPILGQPPSGDEADAELYVVGSNGKIFAFRANDVEWLWTVELGFNIATTAQPVLVPHADGGGTLWLVGAQGQVRGLRVASNGLNRSAPWPKAFRDNCNTSSRLITPTNMPACF